ncbi:RidA family protein [Halorubrum tebenquichense]|uniref:Endoribonuclease L-PSP n=1 Tax=Halorubrum tebenquichense DSM 14210 TaxID=1227485 RepID=M0DBL6_9EURY|nr:endoribonuclease L-PSP [Halorubrum tebenquichense DSM 14210]
MVGVSDQAKRENKISIAESLSEESKRQRDGIENIGAFGMRTGESDLIFFQGILPEINGEVKGLETTEEQIEMCLDRLELMLENRNASLDDVMKVEVQLADTDAASAVDPAYESRFDNVAFPPRTVVGVCSLPGGADVQLDVIAAKE